MDIAEYREWRRAFLANPVGTPLDTPRGKCIVGRDFTIHALVRHGWHMQNRDLEDAEFNLIFHGQDMSPEWRDKLYGNDDDLYNAYKSLHVETLATNGKRRASRKNIIFNKECCLCYWQLHGQELTVISRSWDIQRAGLSDLILVNRAAQMLGCKMFRIVTLCNHVYEDRNTIARRHDAPAGI
jgi:hypothetical protein